MQALLFLKMYKICDTEVKLDMLIKFSGQAMSKFVLIQQVKILLL